MSSVEVYFCALPEEIEPIVVEFVKELRVHVVATWFPPFRAAVVPVEKVSEVLRDPGSTSLIFTRVPPVIPAGGTNQLLLLDENPDFATLRPGWHDRKGLGESWFTCKVNDPAALAVWKKLAQRIKKITTAGMTVENPNLGIRGPGRNHRYTAGAKRLHDGGVPLLTINNMLLHPGMEDGGR